VARARNAGAQAADAPWLCFFDADVILDAQFAPRLLEMIRPGQFFVAHPWVRELAGTVVCSRTDFERVGGYDEVIQGWATEDREFYERLLAAGCTQSNFSSAWVKVISHDDALRTRYHDVQDLALVWAMNRLYVRAKRDLMKLRGTLDLTARQSLYQEAAQVARQWWRTRQDTQWRFDLGSDPLWNGPDLVGTLMYTLTGAPARP
jgi:hypothetical protein